MSQFFDYNPERFAVSEVSLEDWQELVKHIVLVNAIPNDAAWHLMDKGIEVEFDRLMTDPVYNAQFFVEHLLTREGVYRSHLNFQDAQFQNHFIDRPYLHWVWNQLVQPHGGTPAEPTYSWENVALALIEPLSSFEQATKGVAFGPYTFKMGSHKLSSQSIILIPKGVEDVVKEHLSEGFLGKIVTYEYDVGNPCIRQAIFRELYNNFPNWHILDEQGREMAPETHHKSIGEEAITFLKRFDGTSLMIIRNQGTEQEENISPAMQEAKQSGRYIVIDHNCITAWLEDKPAFQALKEFTKDRNTAEKNELFAGNAPKDSPNLAIMDAFAFYIRMTGYARETKAWEFADYVLNEMVHADLLSVCHKEYPKQEIDFTPPELYFMTAYQKNDILNLLNEISVNRREEGAFDQYFSSYKDLLVNTICAILKSRELLQNHLTEVQVKKESEFLQIEIQEKLEQEWNQVHKETLQLGKIQDRWPPTAAERDYLEKIRNLFPNDLKRLVSSYKYVLNELNLSLTDGEPLKRLSYLSFSLKLYLQEVLYLKSQKSNESSTLVYPYDMQPFDANLKLGNCLFDNIVRQIEPEAIGSKQEALSADLRCACVKYLRGNPEFEQFFGGPGKLLKGSGLEEYEYKDWKQYLKYLALDGVWADQLVLRAMAEYLDRPIVLIVPNPPIRSQDIYHDRSQNIYHEKGKCDPLFIALNENHFISLSPPKGVTGRVLFQQIRDGLQ